MRPVVGGWDGTDVGGCARVASPGEEGEVSGSASDHGDLLSRSEDVGHGVSD
jgi:hypothetical protein